MVNIYLEDCKNGIYEEISLKDGERSLSCIKTEPVYKPMSTLGKSIYDTLKGDGEILSIKKLDSTITRINMNERVSHITDYIARFVREYTGKSYDYSYLHKTSATYYTICFGYQYFGCLGREVNELYFSKEVRDEHAKRLGYHFEELDWSDTIISTGDKKKEGNKPFIKK